MYIISETHKGVIVDFTDFFTFLHLFMEKEMAPHSSTLAWKIPWIEKLGRLQSTGLLRVGYD